MPREDVRKRQLFGKLVRILLSTDNEIHIILTKDLITEETLSFLKQLDKRYRGKDIIITFHKLIRNFKKGQNESS